MNQDIVADKIVSYREYNDSQFIIREPVKGGAAAPPRTSTTPVASSVAPSYQSCVFEYNYGKGGKSDVDKFYLEGPELESFDGIESKEFMGKLVHQIKASLSLSCPEKSAFVTCIHKIYAKARAYLYERRVSLLKKTERTTEDSIGESFKIPLYYPTDKQSGEVVEGKDPSIYIKCFKYGEGSLETKTVFTRPDGVVIPWERLTPAHIKFIPLFHVKGIYVGAVTSFQIVLDSAIIIWRVPRGGMTRQGGTARRLLSERPDLAALVTKQLSLSEQDSSSIMEPDPQSTEAQSGDAGAATIQSGSGSPPASKSSLYDFLGKGTPTIPGAVAQLN